MGHPQIAAAIARGDYAAALRLARQHRGWSQAELGRRTGYDRSAISRIETGHHALTASLVHHFAAVLDIPALVVLPQRPMLEDDQPEGDPVRRREFLAAAGITALTVGDVATRSPRFASPLSAQAVLATRLETIITFPDLGSIARLDAVPTLLGAARHDYRNTRYARLAGRLATLVASTEAAVVDQSGPATYAMLAEAYIAVTRALYKLPVSPMEWIAADRAVRAALRAERPELLAEAQRQMAIAYRRAGRPDTTVEVCTRGADQLLSSGGTRHAAQAANLYCTSAYAAAKTGDSERTYELLGDARRLMTGEIQPDDQRWESFTSRMNVDIYAISCATVLRDPGTALRAVRAVDLRGLPSTERRARYLVDSAAAFAAAGQPVPAAAALTHVGRVAPQEVSSRPAVRALATSLRRAYPATDRTLRQAGL